MTAPSAPGVLAPCPLCHKTLEDVYDHTGKGHVVVSGMKHPWSPEETCALRHHIVRPPMYAAWNNRAPAEVTEEAVKMVARLLCCGKVNPLTPAGECCRPDDCYAILERSNENRASRFSQMDMARKVCAALAAIPEGGVASPGSIKTRDR